jgi:hypothetical protein
MASVLIVARFCEPSSELHIAEEWYRRPLGDLLQLGDEEVNNDRLYRGLDHLLAHKAALEAHLSAQMRRAVLRWDCPEVCVGAGLIFTRGTYPRT